MTFAGLAGVFGLIFVLELPDKTMFATIMMSARARPLMVFVGAASAFVVHMAIATLLGGLLVKLPHTVRDSVVAVAFLGGAAYLLFIPEKKQEEEGSKEASREVRSTRFREALTAFTVIFIGEFGDLSQIQAANLVAKTHQILEVFVGATAALVTVSALGAFMGQTLVRYLPLAKIRVGGGLIFAGLGIYTVVGLFS